MLNEERAEAMESKGPESSINGCLMIIGLIAIFFGCAIAIRLIPTILEFLLDIFTPNWSY